MIFGGRDQSSPPFLTKFPLEETGALTMPPHHSIELDVRVPLPFSTPPFMMSVPTVSLNVAVLKAPPGFTIRFALSGIRLAAPRESSPVWTSTGPVVVRALARVVTGAV